MNPSNLTHTSLATLPSKQGLKQNDIIVKSTGRSLSCYTSIKTRIETGRAKRGLRGYAPSLATLPSKQGLKHRLDFRRIDAVQALATLPSKQGLKHHQSTQAFRKALSLATLPSKQGLKLRNGKNLSHLLTCALATLPSKQGLKPLFDHTMLNRVACSCYTSIKTRIETTPLADDSLATEHSCYTSIKTRIETK